MNKVILLGRLAREPEVRYTQTAEPLAVCSFTVAVNRPYSKDKEQSADFINCVCFGKRGENIGQYFRKGNRIAISGRIQTRNYTDQQGNKRYVTEVVVEDFEFVENKAEGTKKDASVPDYTNNSFFFDGEEVTEDDLPF